MLSFENICSSTIVYGLQGSVSLRWLITASAWLLSGRLDSMCSPWLFTMWYLYCGIELFRCVDSIIMWSVLTAGASRCLDTRLLSWRKVQHYLEFVYGFWQYQHSFFHIGFGQFCVELTNANFKVTFYAGWRASSSHWLGLGLVQSLEVDLTSF